MDLKRLRWSVQDDGSGDEAWGQGECFSLSRWRPTSCESRDITSRDNDGLKRRLAPSSTARSPGQGPTPAAICGGLESYALATASPSSTAIRRDMTR